MYHPAYAAFASLYSAQQFDIFNLNSSLFYWDSAAASITSEGNAITRVDDLFINGNEQPLLQPVAATSPQIEQSDLNGLDVFGFNGEDQWLETNFQLDDYAATGVLSIYVVCKPDRYDGSRYILDDSDDLRGIGLRFDDNEIHAFAYKIHTTDDTDKQAVHVRGTSGVKVGEWRVVRLDIQKSGHIALYENNLLLDTQPFPASIRTAFLNMRIGCRVEGDHHFDGQMKSVLMAKNISSAHHDELYNYLAIQAGILEPQHTLPDFWHQFHSPWHRWDYMLNQPYIYVPATPENFANPEVNDKFSHWHRMMISPDTPNGYILGTLPVSPEQLNGTGVWALSGTDAAKFAIDGNGQITLSDADKVTVAGDLAITVTTPAGGTYDITVPVFDPASKGSFYGNSFRFYDSNGAANDYATQGGSAHDGLNVMEHMVTHTKRPERSYFKRGSDWQDARLDFMISWPTARHIYDYGDPSQPRPKFTIDPTYGGSGAIDRTGSHVPNGCVIEGIEIDCNDTVARGLNASGWRNITISRVRVTNNTSTGSPHGFYFKDIRNMKLRWCDTQNHYGDGFYITTGRSFEVAFGMWREARGGGADSGQVSNEDDTDQNNYDYWIHNNIGLVDPLLNTGKGACACSGGQRGLQEYNLWWSDFFAGTMGDFFTTARYNFYLGNSTITGTRYVTGYGAALSSGQMKQYGNIAMHGGRGYTYSGYNTESWQGNEYNRTDLLLAFNIGYDLNEMFFLDQPWTGHIRNNYGINVNIPVEDRRGVASLDGDIVSIAVDDQKMTLTLSKKTHLYNGAVVTINDPNNADNNVSAPVTLLEYNILEVTSPSVNPPVASSGAGMTYSATPTYVDKTLENNIVASPTKESAPVLGEHPIITGVCQEGQQVTCAVKLPVGYTAVYFWHISGVENVAMVGHEPNIPVGVSGIDAHKPDLSAIGKDIAGHDLGCVVEITETATGHKNIYHAVWDDTNVHTKVIQS